MYYQITYFSPDGHAKGLAEKFRAAFPGETLVTPLQKNTLPEAQVQVVGFELKENHHHVIPPEVSDYLRKLEGKTVCVYATVPMHPGDLLQRRICDLIIPFLPRECDYRGLYLCAAEPSEKTLERFRDAISKNPHNTRAKHWLKQCEEAADHPDQTDIQQGIRFLRHVLDIERIRVSQ